MSQKTLQNDPYNACFLLHNFHIVKDNGKTVYEVCRNCSARRCWQRPGGHQPIDEQWIETGEWFDIVKQFVPFKIGARPK